MIANFHSMARTAVGEDVLSYRVPKSLGRFGINVDANAIIVRFDMASCAHDAGLRQGDRIVGINGVAFDGLDHMEELARRESSMVISVRRAPPLA